MSAGRQLLVVCLICLSVLTWSGCGSGTAAAVNPAPTVTMTASATTIAPNASTTLTWNATNATSVSIDQGVGAVAAAGSVAVKPTKTTTYTITATGAGGTVTATVTVTVSAAATTVTLTALPTTIGPNGSSVLTWSSTNATAVSIDQGVGAVTPLASGSVTVKPTQTTTYTITATGAGGSVTATATVTVTATPPPVPTVTLTATPATIPANGSTTLAWTSTNATAVSIDQGIGAVTPLASGSTTVSPKQNTTYTITATGAGGSATATATVTVVIGNVTAVNHVLFLMQENRTFDTYFGMLNPYRIKKGLNIGDDGKQYDVDGIDDKLSTTNDTDTIPPKGNPTPLESIPLFKTTSTCLDDMTSAWLESYGEVSRFNFTPARKIKMDGFVHVAENFASLGTGSGTFTDFAGKRAMAYYDEGFLNYYYYMASNFALSDRWFSPVSSKSTPNRIATMTGGTTQGLVKDPFVNDKLTTLSITTIFQQLDEAKPAVSWKIYYSLTDSTGLPVTTFFDFGYSGKYFSSAPCALPMVPVSPTVCVDPTHIAPLSQLFTDMTAGTLPSFAYIEADYGTSDEHPGSGQSILVGQAAAANMINSLMASPSWKDSVFFLTFDEGGGPYDHVPPVPGHSNDFTSKSLLTATGGIPDIGGATGKPGDGIAVNPDGFAPCLPPPVPGTPTTNCDLNSADPGATLGDAAEISGFAAQLGFRLPNMIVSPFTRKHFVSHTPMDHTAVIKFVESRFIGPNANLTARDAAQPNLLEFFDFLAVPWSTAPTPPAPVTDATLGRNTCTPDNMGP